MTDANVNRDAGTIWGARRSLNSCFAAPGPCVPVVARSLRSRPAIAGRSASVPRMGQGHAPAPQEEGRNHCFPIRAGAMFWRASRHSYIVPHISMGIDKSLTDDFPSVIIDGRRYHYGRDKTYGNYLVENAEIAKDYWSFDTADELHDFLTMLPESADQEWATHKYPNWHEVSDRQRSLWIEERKKELHEAAARRRMENPDSFFFTVLQFDSADWYFAPGNRFFDDIVVACECHELAPDQKEWIVTLRKGNEYGPYSEETDLKISREQASKVAAALLNAANDARRHQENA